MPSFRAPISVSRDGRYRVRLGSAEREIVRELCDELRELIRRDTDDVARLYPAAYRDDEEAAAEFDEMVRSDLKAQRLEALDTVARTLGEDEIDHEAAEAWCGALNDLRLVLGERLGVTEETDFGAMAMLRHPQPRELALYGWLTYLQGNLVEALASRLR